VSSASFLICISRRQQVAQIRGKPVFVITEVAFIPLASQAEARAAILEARDAVQRHHQARAIEAGESIEYSDSSSEGDISTAGSCEFNNDDLSFPAPPDLLSGSPELLPGATCSGPRQRRTSIAEDVIGKRGLYGRFAEKWFSRRGWSVEKMRMQGMSTGEHVKEELLSNGDATTPNPMDAGRYEGADGTTQSEDLDQNTLLPKLLRTTKLLLGSSRSFFYSYEHDITQSLKSQGANASGLPLHKVVDPLVSSALGSCHLKRESKDLTSTISTFGIAISLFRLSRLANTLWFFLLCKDLSASGPFLSLHPRTTQLRK